MPVAVDLLRRATAGTGPALEFVDFPWGCDFYLETGRMMPAEALDTLRASTTNTSVHSRPVRSKLTRCAFRSRRKCSTASGQHRWRRRSAAASKGR